MSINAGNKSALRKQIREKRKMLSQDQQSAAAHELLAQMKTLSYFGGASKLAMYLSNDGEIDPKFVMQWCWENSQKTFVPIVAKDKLDSLMFAEVNDKTEFVKNRFGINEPMIAPQLAVSARTLDLVLMPLVAFDSDGNRVGMGGGFYDRAFEFLKSSGIDQPKIIGLAHELQKVEKINFEQWDIPLSLVVTDKSVYHFA